MRDDLRLLLGGAGGASILSLMDFFIATREDERMQRLLPLIDFIGLNRLGQCQYCREKNETSKIRCIQGNLPRNYRLNYANA
jgi:hypothetical protein